MLCLPLFWKSRSLPKEEKGLLPAGLAAGVTPTQGKRDTSTPWGSLSTDHWCHCFKTKELGPIRAYPPLQEMQHLRRQRLAREEHTDHPEGSPSTAQPQGLLQPASVLADPGLPTEQIKTHKPLGHSLRAGHSWRIRVSS